MGEEKNKELAARIGFHTPSISIRTDVHGDKVTTFKIKLNPASVGEATLLALMQEVTFEADIFVVRS